MSHYRLQLVTGLTQAAHREQRWRGRIQGLVLGLVLGAAAALAFHFYWRHA